jgi:hypothetical protein
MIEEMKSLVLALETELTKFEGGNKSAGTRARKLCQDIKAKAPGYPSGYSGQEDC